MSIKNSKLMLAVAAVIGSGPLVSGGFDSPGLKVKQPKQPKQVNEDKMRAAQEKRACKAAKRKPQ